MTSSHKAREREGIGDWCGEAIRPGEWRKVELADSDGYFCNSARIPIHSRRTAEQDGLEKRLSGRVGFERLGHGAVGSPARGFRMTADDACSAGKS